MLKPDRNSMKKENYKLISFININRKFSDKIISRPNRAMCEGQRKTTRPRNQN